MKDRYFKLVDNYFKHLVNSTEHIKTYVSISERELLNTLSRTTLKDDPILVFFSYVGKLDGNKQRTIGPRTISFSILYRSNNTNDFEKHIEMIDQAEYLGLQVIARMQQDSHPMSDVEWLKNAFDKKSVNYTEVTYKTPHTLFGIEFTLDLILPTPLIVEKDFWTDKDYC